MAMAYLPGIAGASPPDGRRYEMVTPIQKNGADALVDTGRVRAAVDGSAVEFASLTPFGDALGNSVITEYVGVRAASGWAVHSVTPPQEALTFPEAVNLRLGYRNVMASDLSKGVFLAKSPLTDTPNVAHVRNLYLRDDLRSPGAGSYRLLTDATALQSAGGGQPYDAAASADLSHVIFESSRNLTAEAVAAGLDPTVPKLYVWIGGDLHLAGILPADEGGGPAAASQAGAGATNTEFTDRTISQDGSRIVFTAPPFGDSGRAGALYLRDDQGTQAVGDDTSVRINAPERTDCADDPVGCSGAPAPDPAGQQPARFWTASTNEAQVFFTTAEQLTNDDHDSTTDLYRWTLEAPAGEHLTRLSVDNEPADGDGADVTGVIGSSEDGEYVYFVATGELVNGLPPGAASRIYVWHNGTVRQVGKLGDGIEALNIPASNAGAGLGKWSRVTPDGTHMIFMSQGSDELTGYDHGDTCNALTTPQCLEVYVYDATANGGAGRLRCASCNPSGARATADAGFVNRFAQGASGTTPYLSRAISDDGRYVFFTSGERLVLDDVNGKDDAYEYDTTTGKVHVLSSGKSTSDSFFMDASADGSNAFIITREQLVAQDNDQSFDLYDVRVNGFPPTPVRPTVSCTGDGCRAPATAPYTSPTPGSATFHGSGDPLDQAGPIPVLSAASLTVTQRRTLARKGHVRISVSVSEGGRVTARLVSRVGRRTRTLSRSAKTVRHGATIRLRLTLGVAAQRQLRQTGVLRAVIVVDYSRTANPQRLAFTLHAR